MEEFLRPHRRLGYDHDALAVYLYNRGAYPIAESEFKRAVWLNPYEIKFKIHLALCLYKLGFFIESAKLAEDILKIKPQDEDIKKLLDILNTKTSGKI